MATDSITKSAREAALLFDHPQVHRSLPDRDGGFEAQRIVSLVPSLSESLVALDLSDRLVGVTEYCVYPEHAFEALPKLGGTKDADTQAILELKPDLVIANQEENTPRVVRQLAEAGIDVWVSYPRTVREGAELLAAIARLGASDEAIATHVRPALDAVSNAERRRGAIGSAAPRVFCPIWRDPWMTITADTYIHDMIELCGGRNVFSNGIEDSGSPGTDGEGADTSAAESREEAGDRRYPRVTLAEVEAARPDVILLPDEPYAFSETDVAELAGLNCPAAETGRIVLIDGTLVSWYGPRITESIRTLAAIFANS